jgi:hypothetical protein
MKSISAIALAICAMAALMTLAHGVPDTTVVHSFMAPNPVVFTAAGGVTVVLHTTDLDTSRLRFEICGSDITQIPAGLPITMAFDAPIHNVMVHQEDMGLALDVRVTGRMTVLSLARDPFLPPGPWQVALGVAFDTLPSTGRIAVGSSEAQAVHYQTAPYAPQSLARATTGCIELFAALGTKG